MSEARFRADGQGAHECRFDSYLNQARGYYMIDVDFVFGATFPCYFCTELTANGISVDNRWVSVCKKCAMSKTCDEIGGNTIRGG